MRTFDFAPLYRSTVGFDRLFERLDAGAARPDWPPYDIERKGENAYQITLAVAGFGPDEIELTQHGNVLLVAGQKQAHQKEAQDKTREILHQGIASRTFKLTFNLADHVKVVGAELGNGLLSVSLVREIPDQLKPRRIQIGAAAPQAPEQDNKPVKIETERQVA